MTFYPLSNNFTLVAILGFIIVFWNTLFIPSWVPVSMQDTWLKFGFAFMVLFIIFIIASIVSVTPEKDVHKITEHKLINKD